MFIKICGLTDPDDVRLAVDAGVDAVGVVFAEDAARVVDDPQPLLEAAGSTLKVAVFHTYTGTPVPGFDIVQAFHFAEPPPLPGLGAFRDRIEEHDALVDALRTAPTTPLGRAVLDGPGGGGRGIPGDWPRARSFAAVGPLMLAGGLTPENVAEAIGIVGPFGVDVSSGVERTPGRKDGDRMRAFVAAARAAGASS